MAGIKESFSKGLTTLNVKTSNFMEENKLRTHIKTLETDIEKLKMMIGEKVYAEWAADTFDVEHIKGELESIRNKQETIESIAKEIEALAEKEKEILEGDKAGSQTGVSTSNISAAATPNPEAVFCPNCGAECRKEHKFCVKCGHKFG